MHVVAPLPTPAKLAANLPLPPHLEQEIRAHRRSIRSVLNGVDDRLIVIAGPCSVHDPVAALDYAAGLSTLARSLSDDLLIVMRAYLEKPRTVAGWRGLVPDPHLDDSGDLAAGLHIGRRFLLDAAATGLPLAAEFVEPMIAPYLADVVSWGCIGARTVASQPHRQLASWLPMPVGFKNTIDGDIGPAVDAVVAAAGVQMFPGLGIDGEPVVMRGPGNHDGHVVLRGGATGPNHDAAAVKATLTLLSHTGLAERVVVDASHGNSGKDHRRQPGVVAELAAQIAGGQRGIRGVMLESFLRAGRQELTPALSYGISVTDACVDFATTDELLHVLADAVRARRG
ncbi:MAG TPA: 3-deoxy-7-phosphoheptulonate synthase [Micromonosporaceae bacterium]|nr:3-deoxy-7-phosphoheptulonate synthase [Micromonosporaceae bacterium]